MSKKLYVGNLQWKTTEEDLTELFGNYGTIKSARLITDRETGKSKGFAFIEMENTEDADRAMTELNGQELGGRNLSISEARERSNFRRNSFA